MALATITELRELLGGAVHITNSRLQSVLNFSKAKVENDGLSANHELFAYLQMYYAASILERTGEIDFVAVSKTVGDVSTAFMGNTHGGFFNIYVKELRNIIGKRGFII